jgi:hypothetical protein
MLYSGMFDFSLPSSLLSPLLLFISLLLGEVKEKREREERE